MNAVLMPAIVIGALLALLILLGPDLDLDLRGREISEAYARRRRRTRLAHGYRCPLRHRGSP
ncbi:hypothetical protein D7D52_34185 [Nocardia yunnanensis]|uniref:Uncharacterized protein n=1 Tax=Nocardia yunnanensis TaxID=2382165 RepID=A0A386ZKQ8_9NOCA|nr:hypothetical protein D7D52_34185 [Nocardia yunnanensis]